MPNIKSAKKRVLVSERRKQENKYVKATMTTMIKKFKVAVKEDTSKAEEMLKEVISYIDSAQTKGIIHKNNASRKISRLSSMLYKAKNVSPNTETVVEKAEKTEKVEEKAVEQEEVKTTKTPKTAKKSVAKKETKKESETEEPVKKTVKKAKKEDK